MKPNRLEGISKPAMKCACVVALVAGSVLNTAMAIEPEPGIDRIEPLGPEDEVQEVFDELQRVIRGDTAQSDEGMEDAARHVLETCYDASTREEVQQLVEEAYWEYYDQYSNFDADSLIERITIEALMTNPAFRRGSVARSGAVELLVLCDDIFNETAPKFPTGLVQILAEEFAQRESYDVTRLISTFARRLQPADKLLWYSIPSEQLRSEDAYEVWGSFHTFGALGVLSTRDELYLRTLIANPATDAPDLWKQLDEPLAIRRELIYSHWDRTMFRADAVAALLTTSRNPDGALEFIASLRGRARIDAARGIVNALWTHADHDFDELSSPFAAEHWTPERFARLFDVLDAILLDPRARLIVGTDFTPDDWGEGEWYYESVVGDLVDLYDSPIEIVAERSIAISKLATSMHAGEDAVRTVERWLKEQSEMDGGWEIDEFMPQ